MIEIELVLLAKIAPGGAIASSCLNRSRLDGFILEDRLNDELNAASGLCQRGGDAHSVELLAAFGFAQLALGYRALQVGPDAGAARLRPGTSGSYSRTVWPAAAMTWAMP